MRATEASSTSPVLNQALNGANLWPDVHHRRDEWYVPCAIISEQKACLMHLETCPNESESNRADRLLGVKVARRS